MPRGRLAMPTSIRINTMRGDGRMRRGVSLPGTVGCKSYAHCIAARLYCRPAPLYRRTAVSSPSLPRCTATLPYRCLAVSLPCRTYRPAVPRPHCNAAPPFRRPVSLPRYSRPTLYRRRAVSPSCCAYRRPNVSSLRRTAAPLYRRPRYITAPLYRRRAVPPPHCIAAPLYRRSATMISPPRCTY
jgi:hypothetical protein